MAETVTFDLIVEGKSEDPYMSAPSALELTNLTWPASVPPDVVLMPGGTLLIQVGRYASAGNRYRYRVASVSRMAKGKLVLARAHPGITVVERLVLQNFTLLHEAHRDLVEAVREWVSSIDEPESNLLADVRRAFEHVDELEHRDDDDEALARSRAAYEHRRGE